MGRKQPPPENPDEPENSGRGKRYQVILDPDLVKKIGIIASALDISIPDWVNNRLRPIVEKELPEALLTLGIHITRIDPEKN